MWRLLAHRPRERDCGGRADQAGQQSEHAVLDQGDADDQPLLRAERLEDRSFVQARKFVIAIEPARISTPDSRTKPPTKETAKESSSSRFRISAMVSKASIRLTLRN